MSPDQSPYRCDVAYYADQPGSVWHATYHSRVVADKAIARAADVLGWVGIITKEEAPAWTE